MVLQKRPGTLTDSRGSPGTRHPETGFVEQQMDQERLMSQGPEGQRSLGLTGRAPPDQREGKC